MNADRRGRVVRALLFLLVGLLAWRGTEAYAGQSAGPADPARAAALSSQALSSQAPSSQTPSSQALEVDLQGRIKDVQLVEVGGQLFVRAEEGAELVPATQWLTALHAAQEEQRARGFLYVLFNITKPWSFAWVAIGFLGQALFTMRMVLQWLASEKEKRSVIPVAFWWGSLFGGILLFVYFVWRKDIVGIVGQSTGIVVYARNLILIRRRTLVAT